MRYHISHIPEANIILIKVSGELDIPTMKEAIEAAGPVILEHACNNILGDFREAEVPLTIVELIELYQHWIKTLKTNQISRFQAKRAMLLNADQPAVEKYRFFETFSTNRSSRVRPFFDQNEAEQWLKGE